MIFRGKSSQNDKSKIKTAKKGNSNAKRCIFVCKIKCNTMFFNMKTIDGTMETLQS